MANTNRDDLLLINEEIDTLNLNNGSSSEEMKKITALITKAGVDGHFFTPGDTLKLLDKKSVSVSTPMYVELAKYGDKCFAFVTIFSHSEATYTALERITDIDKLGDKLSRKEIKATPENTIVDTAVTNIIKSFAANRCELFLNQVVVMAVNVSKSNNPLEGIQQAIKLNHAAKRAKSIKHLTSLVNKDKTFKFTKAYKPNLIDNMNTQFEMKASIDEANDKNDESIMWFDSNGKGDDVVRFLYSLSVIGRRVKEDGKVINKLVPYVRITGANYVSSAGNVDNSALAIAIAVKGIITAYKSNPAELSEDIAKVLSNNGDVKATMKKINPKSKTMRDAIDTIDLGNIFIGYSAKIGGADSIAHVSGVTQHIVDKGIMGIDTNSAQKITNQLLSCVIEGNINSNTNYVNSIVMQPLYDGVDIIAGSPMLTKLDNWSSRPSDIGERISAFIGMGKTKGAEIILAKYLGGNRSATPKAGYAISYLFTEAMVNGVNDAINGNMDGVADNAFSMSGGIDFEPTTTLDSSDGLGIVRF